jgi:hypothetical protein
MKLFTIIFFFPLIIFSQINQKDFDEIRFKMYEKCKINIKSTNDLKNLFDYVLLNDSISIFFLEKSDFLTFENTNILDEGNRIIFFFEKIKNNENKLKLTCFAAKNIKTNNLFRTKYLFVLENEVSLKDNELMFENNKFITNENDIRDWYIKYLNYYLIDTDSVFKTYNFIPPPPLFTPHFFKHTPEELYKSRTELIKLEKWKDYVLVLNELIVYFPDEPRLYYDLAYTYYLLNIDYCEIFKLSLEKGLLVKFPKYKNEAKFALEKCKI